MISSFFFSYYSFHCNESSHSNSSEKCSTVIMQTASAAAANVMEERQHRRKREETVISYNFNRQRGWKKKRLDWGCSFLKLFLTTCAISTPLAVQGQKLVLLHFLFYFYFFNPLFFQPPAPKLDLTPRLWQKNIVEDLAEFLIASLMSNPWYSCMSQMAVRKLPGHLSGFPQQWNHPVSITSSVSNRRLELLVTYLAFAVSFCLGNGGAFSVWENKAKTNRSQFLFHVMSEKVEKSWRPCKSWVNVPNS